MSLAIAAPLSMQHHRRTQDFPMNGVHMARGLGDFVPQKPKQNVKLAYNF